jgi:hypothetical protein
MASALRLPQHSDQHRSERLVVLAVDQQLREGSALRVAPELADPLGTLKIGEHEDVEQFGAWSWPEGVQRRQKPSLEFNMDAQFEVSRRRRSRSRDRRNRQIERDPSTQRTNRLGLSAKRLSTRCPRGSDRITMERTPR